MTLKAPFPWFGGKSRAASLVWQLLRIALCGYEGEHKMPPSWKCVPWKTRGGYGSQSHGLGRENSHRERIWFSPHCLKALKEKAA